MLSFGTTIFQDIVERMLKELTALPPFRVFFLVGEVVASEIAVQPLHPDTDTAVHSLCPVSS